MKIGSKHRNYNKNQNNKGYSKSATDFFKKLHLLIKKDFETKDNIFYGKNEYSFFLNEGKRQFIKPDFYIKELNLVIEYYGDFWHKNPKAGYNDEISKLINKKDYIREQILKNTFKCKVIVIWEKDVNNDPEKILNMLLKTILKLKYDKILSESNQKPRRIIN